ncbi:unnamed protein product [Paramecium sonneborni]|uniref:EF-hand domain-containing protein n=1 Tax=Paramecium sonneborni TaxID=65129 RepID=A0A8S1RTA1_9CILI|nr:unnamed protein product [Paramecium sonneborni]
MDGFELKIMEPITPFRTQVLGNFRYDHYNKTFPNFLDTLLKDGDFDKDGQIGYLEFVEIIDGIQLKKYYKWKSIMMMMNNKILNKMIKVKGIS